MRAAVSFSKGTIVYMVIALLVITTATMSFISVNVNDNPNATGFAVVELFTSEGCSSCPPADALVAKVQQQYRDKPVYILAYHVDYWNRLGWKDVFSNNAYSQRQRSYAGYFKQSVYTPQIVVNGKKEFVGSQSGTLHNAIEQGLRDEKSVPLTLSAAAGGTKVAVNYQTNVTGNNTVLLLALVERSAHTKVTAGENSGRNLSHVQIVRDLVSVNLAAAGKGAKSLALPNGTSLQSFEVIGLIQDTTTGAVTGAAKTTLL